MAGPIGIGVIGCGDIAVTRHVPAIDAFPGTRLVALCDSSLERAQQLAVAYPAPVVTDDYKQLLHNPDITAVVVATPPWVTPHITMDCLHAGKHVLCEKPMAVDVDVAKQVERVATDTGTKLQIGFTYRHNPLLETMRRWIREGRLGSPLIYRLGIFDEVWDPVGNPEHYHRIFHTMEHGSPVIHDGAHVSDWLHFLTGSQVQRVEAFGMQTRPEFPSTNYDTAVVHFENGDIAKVEIGWFFPKFPVGEFEVLGPKGIAIWDRFKCYVELQVGAVRETVHMEEEWGPACFREQLQKFVHSILNDQPCIPGPAEGIASLGLTKAIEAGIKNNHQ